VDIVIDIVLLVLLLARQVTTRPLSDSYRLPMILVIIGIVEFAAFVTGGGQQFAQIVKGQRSFMAIHGSKTVAVALIGSLALAALFAAIRAPTFRLWWQDGQYWRKGSALTLALWIVSLAAHLAYDDLVSRNAALNGLANATILLYIAVSLGIQRMLLGRRASHIARGDSPPSPPRAATTP
jgi:hypothetical protein